MAKPKLGSGKRFSALRTALAQKPDVTDPDALAAAIARKKYGKARLQQMAADGRRRAAGK